MNGEKWQAEDLEMMQPDWALHAQLMILCSKHIHSDSK